MKNLIYYSPYIPLLGAFIVFAGMAVAFLSIWSNGARIIYDFIFKDEEWFCISENYITFSITAAIQLTSILLFISWLQ